MSKEAKIVKGGFRATLALIVAIIALIISWMAYNRTGGKDDMRTQINNLQATIQKLKDETSQKLDKVREETSNTLEKLGESLKKKGENQP